MQHFVFVVLVVAFSVKAYFQDMGSKATIGCGAKSVLELFKS